MWEEALKRLPCQVQGKDMKKAIKKVYWGKMKNWKKREQK